MDNYLARIRFRRDHRWTPNHLSEFVDGELPARSRSRLRRHLEQCPDCSRALLALQRLLDRMHRMPTPSADDEMPDIAGAVRRRLDEADNI